jgi:hypothetical protein
MKISRRKFLKLGLMGGTALVLPLGAARCSSVGQDLTGRLLRSEAGLPEPFRVPLAGIAATVRNYRGRQQAKSGAQRPRRRTKVG